jgi:hypothetical protein
MGAMRQSGGGRTSCFPAKTTTTAPPLTPISSVFYSSLSPALHTSPLRRAWWQAGAASSYSPRAIAARRGVLRLAFGRALQRPLLPPTTSCSIHHLLLSSTRRRWSSPRGLLLPHQRLLSCNSPLKSAPTACLLHATDGNADLQGRVHWAEM